MKNAQMLSRCESRNDRTRIERTEVTNMTSQWNMKCADQQHENICGQNDTISPALDTCEYVNN